MSRNLKAYTDVSICKHFLAAECDRLISMAKPRMERSGVSYSLTGKVKNRATTMVLHCSRAQDGGVDDVLGDSSNKLVMHPRFLPLHQLAGPT
jgi:predicted short-subunit dehydrogenase-like oxidoreductase (DUF2520 family)